MDDAGLDHRFGEHRGNRVWKALRAVNDGQQDILDAAVQPEADLRFAAFCRDDRFASTGCGIRCPSMREFVRKLAPTARTDERNQLHRRI